MQNERDYSTGLSGLLLISVPPFQLILFTSTLDNNGWFLPWPTVKRGVKRGSGIRIEKVIYGSQTPAHTRTFWALVYEPVVHRKTSSYDQCKDTQCLCLPQFICAQYIRNPHTKHKAYSQFPCSTNTKLFKPTNQINYIQLELFYAPQRANLQLCRSAAVYNLLCLAEEVFWCAPVQRTTTISSAFLATDHA